MAETPQYDVVVIGSGPGGYVAAIRSSQLGMKTAIVEKDDKFGGTCLHVGCIPTKSLLFNAEVYDYFRNAKDFGLTCQEFSFNWQAILARKAKVVTKLSKGVEFLLKKNHVDMVRGFAKLAGPGKISVTDSKGIAQEIAAKNLVLATGSEARLLPGLEPDAKTLLTNKEILSLPEVPKSLVIIGAGAVGVEFASIFHRFGSKVTVLEMLPRAVPLEDEEVSAELEKSFRRQGIVILTQAKVAGITKTSNGITLEYTVGVGKPQSLEADSCLVAVGRAPNTANLGLERTRVRLERGFVKVNSFMQTDEPGVYAIGDIVADSPLLAHVASREGIVAVTHAAGKPAEPLNYRQIPNCTYCEPEIGSVGLSERQAREAGHPLKIGRFPYSAVSKAVILGAREGFVKIVSDERYGEILGVHIIGPRATETIAEAVMAMRLEGTADDLANVVHAHPTLAEGLGEAAHAVVDWPIHI